MEALGFYVKWVKRTFGKAIVIFAFIASIVAVVGGTVIFLNPQWEGTVGQLYWIIPLIVLGVAVVVVGIWAPYMIYRDEHKSHTATKRELKIAQETKPNITVVSDPEDNNVRLRVENHGGNATFTARGRFLEHPSGTPWPIQWRNTSDEFRDIHGNNHDLLNVASISQDIEKGTKVGDPYVFIHTANQPYRTGLGPYTNGMVRDRFRLDDLPNSVAALPVLTIELTITADPPLPTPYQQCWQLDQSNGQLTLNPKMGVTLAPEMSAE